MVTRVLVSTWAVSPIVTSTGSRDSRDSTRPTDPVTYVESTLGGFSSKKMSVNKTVSAPRARERINFQGPFTHAFLIPFCLQNGWARCEARLERQLYAYGFLIEFCSIYVKDTQSGRNASQQSTRGSRPKHLFVRKSYQKPHV